MEYVYEWDDVDGWKFESEWYEDDDYDDYEFWYEYDEYCMGYCINASTGLIDNHNHQTERITYSIRTIHVM